jgi:hypothetical protein
MIGTRTSAKLTDWAKDHSKSRIGTFADAAKFGQLVVLAVLKARRRRTRYVPRVQ